MFGIEILHFLLHSHRYLHFSGNYPLVLTGESMYFFQFCLKSLCLYQARLYYREKWPVYLLFDSHLTNCLFDPIYG